MKNFSGPTTSEHQVNPFTSSVLPTTSEMRNNPYLLRSNSPSSSSETLTDSSSSTSTSETQSLNLQRKNSEIHEDIKNQMQCSVSELKSQILNHPSSPSAITEV